MKTKKRTKKLIPRNLISIFARKQNCHSCKCKKNIIYFKFSEGIIPQTKYGHTLCKSCLVRIKNKKGVRKKKVITINNLLQLYEGVNEVVLKKKVRKKCK